jgi:hypothetical protein
VRHRHLGRGQWADSPHAYEHFKKYLDEHILTKKEFHQRGIDHMSHKILIQRDNTDIRHVYKFFTTTQCSKSRSLYESNMFHNENLQGALENTKLIE